MIVLPVLFALERLIMDIFNLAGHEKLHAIDDVIENALASTMVESVNYGIANKGEVSPALIHERTSYVYVHRAFNQAVDFYVDADKNFTASDDEIIEIFFKGVEGQLNEWSTYAGTLDVNTPVYDYMKNTLTLVRDILEKLKAL